MPWPLAIFFTALVGWPTVKLVATILSRPRWKEQKIARTALLEVYGDRAIERQIIEDEFVQGKGELVNILMPVAACFAGLAIAFTLSRDRSDIGTIEGGIRIEKQLTEVRYPDADLKDIDALLRDERFRQYRDRSFELELLRYPIVSGLTLILLLPTIIAFAGIEGIRLSFRRAAKNIIEASQGATKFLVLLSSEKVLGPPTAP